MAEERQKRGLCGLGCGALPAGFFAHGAYWFGPGDYFIGQAGYLHRFRLVGDDRVGLGLDLSAGLGGGVGDDEFNRRDLRVGPNDAVSIDLRVYGFIVGLVTRTHVFVGPAPTESITTTMLRLSFGFYGGG